MLNLYYSQKLSHSTDFRGSRVAPSWLPAFFEVNNRAKTRTLVSDNEHKCSAYIPNKRKPNAFQRSVCGAGNRT